MSEDDQSADDEDVPSLTRRRLVATGAAGWASVSLAGCSRVLDPKMTGAGDSGGGSGGGGGSDGGSDSDGSSDGGSDGGSDGSSDGGSDGGSAETSTPGGNTTVTNETTTTGESDGGATETPTGTSTGTACASIRRFAAGMNVGIHVMAFDNDSGSVLGADAIERIVVEFLDGDFDPLQLNWEGDHEAYTDISWGGMISTSEDLDPGTYQYEITVYRENSEPETIVDEFTIV